MARKNAIGFYCSKSQTNLIRELPGHGKSTMARRPIFVLIPLKSGMEIKSAPDVGNDDSYTTHEIKFLEVKTNRGVFTMVSHNEHTGYYGGFLICSAVE